MLGIRSPMFALAWNSLLLAMSANNKQISTVLSHPLQATATSLNQTCSDKESWIQWTLDSRLTCYQVDLPLDGVSSWSTGCTHPALLRSPYPQQWQSILNFCETAALSEMSTDFFLKSKTLSQWWLCLNLVKVRPHRLGDLAVIISAIIYQLS